MKKDIILKEEIGRIHELMNVKPLIFEQLNYLFESELIVESILPDLIRAGVDAADNLIKSGKRLSPDIQKYLNDLSNAVDDIAKSKAIANLMDESPEIFNSVYSVYIRTNKTLLDTVSTNIDKALKNASAQNLTQVQDRLEQIVEIQSKQLTRQIPSKKLAKELENGWKKQIKDFDKYNVPIPGTSLNQSIKIWMTKAFPNLGTVKNMIKNAFKNFDALRDEFLELDKLATAKLRAGRDATVEIKRMADIVASINKKQGKVAEEVWNTMDTAGQQGWKNAISPEVLKKLAYNSQGKPWDGIIEAITATDDSLKTATSAYWDMLKLNKPDAWRRLFSYLSYGDPRKPAELVKYMQTQGLPVYIMERAVAFFVITPLILNFLRNAIPALGSAAEAGVEGITGERPEWTTFGENQKWWEPWWEGYKESIPGDGPWEAIGRFLTPSALDEVWKGATSFLGGIQSPDVDKLKQKYKNDYEEFKDELSDEDREKLEEAENQAGLRDESGSETSTEEEPLTYNPALNALFSNYPCLKEQYKNGEMKKLSDTELTIMGNGSKWNITVESDGKAFFTKKNGVTINPVPVQCG